MAQDKTEKQDEGFKVVDRRLFTEEGELRRDVAEEHDRDTARERAKELEKSKAAPQPQTAQPATTTTSTAAAASPAPPPAAEAQPQAAPPSRSFQMIIDVLARNAELMLGGVPDPRTGQAYLDLEGAREMIDMLDALKEKTQGNLSPDEDRLLRDVAGALKLSYMQISKAAADAMRAQAPAKP